MLNLNVNPPAQTSSPPRTNVLTTFWRRFWLKRHLDSNHSNKKDRGESYFQGLDENLERLCLDKTVSIYQRKKGIGKASHVVALLVAKNTKAHTIGVSLVIRATMILVKQVIGEEVAAKLESVSLSNSTVKNQIEEMSVDIAEQVISGVKDSKFGCYIQLDESKDEQTTLSYLSICLLYGRQFCENWVTDDQVAFQ